MSAVLIRRMSLNLSVLPQADHKSLPAKHLPRPHPGVLQRSWATPRSPPSYEAPDKRKVIGEEHSIAEGQPMQTASGQREVLMDRQNPHCHTGDAKLEDDKEGGAIRQGQVHQGIRLAPAVLQVE